MYSILLHPILIIVSLIVEINTSIIFAFSLTEVNLSKVLRKSIVISIIVGILFYYLIAFTNNKFSLLVVFLLSYLLYFFI